MADIEGDTDVDYATSLARKFTILDALKFVSLAWSEVTTEAIKACFANCGFLEVPLPAFLDLEEENLCQIVARVSIRQLEVEENLDCFVTIETEDDFELVLASNFAENAEEVEDDPPTTEQINDLPITKMTFNDVKSGLLDMANYFEENGMVETTSDLAFLIKRN